MANKDVKPYTRRVKTNFVLQEVLNIIMEVIDTYIEDDNILVYNFLLAKKGLYASKLQYWVANHEEVKSLMNELQGLAEAKLQWALADGKKGNTTGILVNLKCNHGWIEEEKRIKLEADKNNTSSDLPEIKIEVVDSDGSD